MGTAGGAIGEALYTKIVLIASAVCASYPDLPGKLLAWGCSTVVLSTPQLLRQETRCGSSRPSRGSNGSWMTYSRSDICRANVANILDTALTASGSNLFANDTHCECDETGWRGRGRKMMRMRMESCLLVERQLLDRGQAKTIDESSTPKTAKRHAENPRESGNVIAHTGKRWRRRVLLMILGGEGSEFDGMGACGDGH